MKPIKNKIVVLGQKTSLVEVVFLVVSFSNSELGHARFLTLRVRK